MPANFFLTPSIPGHDVLAAPAYSFLIEHKSPDAVTRQQRSRNLLFDLGVRKDWADVASPAVRERFEPGGGKFRMRVEKNVRDILEENGFDVVGKIANEATGARDGGIEAVIWTHWHFDHVGDPSSFPPTTKLIVGPGFKEKMLPGYPSHPNSKFLESDYTGRDLVEVSSIQGGRGGGGATGGIKVGRLGGLRKQQVCMFVWFCLTKYEPLGLETHATCSCVNVVLFLNYV